MRIELTGSHAGEWIEFDDNPARDVFDTIVDAWVPGTAWTEVDRLIFGLITGWNVKGKDGEILSLPAEPGKVPIKAVRQIRKEAWSALTEPPKSEPGETA